MYASAMALFALSFVLMNYSLSLDRTKIAYPLLGVTLLQFGLIIFFHTSISQIVDMMLVSATFCISLMLPYAIKAARASNVKGHPMRKVRIT